MNKLIPILLLSLSACDTTPALTLPSVHGEIDAGTPPDHGEVPGLLVMSRGPRRMSITQLERSLEVVSGLPTGSFVLDDTLRLSLGEPDYLRVTEETLEPSALFMKFQMDIAGVLCPALTDIDATLEPAERVLARFSDREENIRYLVARFLSLSGEDADSYVTPLSETYDLGAAGALGADGGWQAVCGALVTSPEFLLY